jgi:DNA repair protein RadC
MRQGKISNPKQTDFLPIRLWSESDRPREKLIRKGRHALSDAELIAIVLASGSLDESALDLSKRILYKVGSSLHELARLSVQDLKQFKGIGEAKAVSIIAALELGLRRCSSQADSKPRITQSQDAYTIMQQYLVNLPHEEFWLLLLTAKNEVFRVEQVSKGGLSMTHVDPKIIFHMAIRLGAARIVLAHNHPSGDTKPSATDIRLTRRLKEGAFMLDLDVVDHIIIGNSSYYSFADEGML